MDLIANLLNNNHKPHALLVVQNKPSSFETFYKSYLLSIFKQNTDDIKEWEEKIIKNQYHDVIIFNGYKNNIKKEDIINLQELFSRQAIEKIGIKAYVIIGIDNCSKSVLNPLLKFLEEPPHNTYAIFLCRNIDKVLPTIRSRCAQIFLPEDNSIFDNLDKEYKLSKEEIAIIKKTYLEATELKIDLESKTINKIFNFINNLSNNIKSFKKGLELLKKMDYYEIGILLAFLGNKFKNNDLFILRDDLQYNPPRSLLFNKILTLIYEK